MDFISLVPIAIPAIAVIILLTMGYVKAPPDQAFIISGLKKKKQDINW